jgi:hypothetical protein
VSPESVVPGSYTLAELGQAERRWPRPAGHLLPVVVAPTPKAAIPPYLMAVTLLEPRGDIVAEAVAEVARRTAPPQRTRRRWMVAAMLALLVPALAWLGYRYESGRRAAAERAREIAIAAAECARDPQVAFAHLSALATRPEAGVMARTELQNCAMAWLRRSRVPQGMASFETLASLLKPVLLQGLAAGATGERAAELHAHLGWADVLRWRVQRQPGIDPEPQFRRALEHDPKNLHAHAMWGHWQLIPPARLDDAKGNFDAALARARERRAASEDAGEALAFVRWLQLVTTVGDERLEAYALSVIDQMRQGNEPVEAGIAASLWSAVYGPAMHPEDLRRLDDALPAEDGLKTFLWLYPRERQSAERLAQWRLLHAHFLARLGRGAEARADLLALHAELRGARAFGARLAAVERLLAERP